MCGGDGGVRIVVEHVIVGYCDLVVKGGLIVHGCDVGIYVDLISVCCLILVMRYSGLFLDYYVVYYVCEYSVQTFYGKKRPEKNIVAGRSSNF